MADKDRKPRRDGSLDDYPMDLVPLEEIQRAQREYDLNEKQARLLYFIKKDIPISGFAKILGAEVWLREVIKDLGSKSFASRTAALRMLGEYFGCIGNKKTKSQPKAVEIEEF